MKATSEQWAQTKKEHAEALFAEQCRLLDCEKQIKEIELAIIDEIANTTGGDGKALYSNAEKRQAEFNRRIKEGDFYHKGEYASLQNTLQGAKQQINRLQIELQYASDMLRICLAFAGKEI